MMRFLALCGAIGLFGVVGAACSGPDSDVTDGTGGGGSGTGGSQASGGSSNSGTGGNAQTGGSSNGGSCEEVQCLRAYECASECGSDDVFNNGCCPCPAGTIDTVSCPDITIDQGVWGEVLWLEGNHQPGAATGTTEPVSREVRVYEAVSNTDVEEAADREDAYGVYSEINGTLVDTVTSDDQGFYELSLEPGSYSVFAEDEGDWYCSRSNVDGQLCMVTVETNQRTEYTIRIDYKAAY